MNSIKQEANIRIISDKRLKEFWAEYPDSERPLKAWLRLMKSKKYQSPHEVKNDFRTADFLTEKVTVFDIGGNKYRPVTTMRYDWGTVFIRHMVTHKEYDRLTARGAL